jgi:hypothetical protein
MKNKKLQKEINTFYLDKLQFDGECCYYAIIQDDEGLQRTVFFPRTGVIEIETNLKMTRFPNYPNNYLELNIDNLETLIRLSKEYDSIIN